MSIVSLFQEEGKNKLNHLQLLKIKTDRNNFFTKRGVCFWQALQFYLEKIGHFLQTSFSIFKDPLNNFWHNRSILLAIHCSQEAFHRTFSLISTILFFPLVMIAGLFQPNIYRKMQDHLVKSFPFFSLHQDKIEQFYTRSSFGRGEIVRILSNLTEKQLEEVYSCIKYSPKAKVDGALTIVALSSPKDLKQIKKIVRIYDRSTFKAEEVLKILSKITEEQLEEVYSCIKYFPKAKVDGALTIVALSSPKDLKQIKKIVRIYDRSTFKAEEVLKILSNLTEEQLEKIYSCIKYSPEAKVDGALNIVAWSSPKDLKQIEKIVKIYDRSAFRAEEVLKILSNLTEELLNDIVFCVGYLSGKKAEDFLIFIKNNQEKILKNGQFLKNIRIAATVYDRTFCDLKQVAYTLSHLSVDQAQLICLCVMAGSDFLQALKWAVSLSDPTKALLKLI